MFLKEGKSTYSPVLKETGHISFHHTTCCGLDFNGDGMQVAVGDFAGNILIWPAYHPHPSGAKEKGEESASECFFRGPLLKRQIPVMIRSVCWRKEKQPHEKELILIGGLGGEVWMWSPFTDQEPSQALALDGVVTCIGWENGPNPRRVALGTSSGILYVYEKVDEGHTITFKEHFTFKAHHPVDGPQDLKFGSLGKFAEV